MLDYRLSATVSDQVWSSASAHAVLPQPHEDFFAVYGASSVAENTRRLATTTRRDHDGVRVRLRYILTGCKGIIGHVQIEIEGRRDDLPRSSDKGYDGNGTTIEDVGLGVTQDSFVNNICKKVTPTPAPMSSSARSCSMRAMF